jgi:hypothetical protein
MVCERSNAAVGLGVAVGVGIGVGLGIGPRGATPPEALFVALPAVSIAYLSEATGRSAYSVRHGLRSLVSAGAVTESRDEDTGFRVFEVPELLQVVDFRQRLLQVCWHSHQAGLGLSAAQLVAEWCRAA